MGFFVHLWCTALSLYIYRASCYFAMWPFPKLLLTILLMHPSNDLCYLCLAFDGVMPSVYLSSSIQWLEWWSVSSICGFWVSFKKLCYLWYLPVSSTDDNRTVVKHVCQSQLNIKPVIMERKLLERISQPMLASVVQLKRLLQVCLRTDSFTSDLSIG